MSVSSFEALDQSKWNPSKEILHRFEDQPIHCLEHADHSIKHIHRLDSAMFRCVNAHYKLESEVGNIFRKTVMEHIWKAVIQWLKTPAESTFVSEEGVKSSMSIEECVHAIAKMETSGSYRLGIHEPDADIDVLIMVHMITFINRDFFFDYFPTVLSSILKSIDEVDDVKIESIKEARVPILAVEISANVDGEARTLDLDVLFARVFTKVDMNTFNLTDDRHVLECHHRLKEEDEASVLSLNGPRVTLWFERNVSHYPTFQLILRYLRTWAKNRCIYGNKFGYLGGVNLAILSAFICRLYPKIHHPSFLISRLFYLMSNWKWPGPLRCCVSAGENMRNEYVLDKEWNVDDAFHVSRSQYDYMPILTPCWPQTNSTKSVTPYTLQHMQREWKRGSDILSLEKDGILFSKKLESCVQTLPLYNTLNYNHAIVLELDVTKYTGKTGKSKYEERKEYEGKLWMEMVQGIKEEWNDDVNNYVDFGSFECSVKRSEKDGIMNVNSKDVDEIKYESKDEDMDIQKMDWKSNCSNWMSARLRMLSSRLHQYHRRYLKEVCTVPTKIELKDGRILWITLLKVNVKKMPIKGKDVGGKYVRKPLNLEYGVYKFKQDIKKYWMGPKGSFEECVSVYTENSKTISNWLK